MFERFTFTPGVFDGRRASSPLAMGLGIGCLNDLCREEGLFLDLCNGGLGRKASANGPEAREFLEFAAKRRRLIKVGTESRDEPDGDEEWLWEGLAVHGKQACRAIITDAALSDNYHDQHPAVVSLERINRTDWWQERSPSIAVERSTQDYLRALGLLLRHSNLLMFIDPHIDPCAPNYAEFLKLPLAAGSTNEQPFVQIHRASWRKVAGRNEVQSLAKWRNDFDSWSDQLVRARRRATVFLWEDVHDRSLVSDMAAVSLPYGFDIDLSDRARALTTWSRLGRNDQDRLEREYDPACPLHRFVGSFDIGEA